MTTSATTTTSGTSGLGTINISGLASGLNTSSLITQLMSVEAAPETKMQWQQDLWKARQGLWQGVSSNLNAMSLAGATLDSPATWKTSTAISSSNASQVTGTAIAGQSASAGTYSVAVSQLATANAWTAASSLPGAAGGTRSTGQFYSAAGVAATSTTLLTGLKTSTGTALGINAGSQISITDTVNGVQHVNTFNVTATSKLSDLQSFLGSQIPGSTMGLTAGKLTIATPAGTASEITALSMTATNAAGAAITAFNGSSGASSSTTTSATDGGATAADTLTITQGSKQYFIQVAKGDNEAAIAAKINAASGGSVQATVSGGKLAMQASTTGAAANFTVASSGTLATTLGLAQTTTGQDAKFTVNGTAYDEQSNTSTDAIPGISLALTGLTGGTPVALSVAGGSATTSSILTAIQGFVSSYNTAIAGINANTQAQPNNNPQSESDYLQAPLAQNYTLENVGYQLRSIASNVLTSNPAGFQTLADIGISTGAVTGTYNPASITGKLTIDTAKLTAALNTNPAAVQALLTQGGTGTNAGIIQQLDNKVGVLIAGGTVDTAIQGASNQISSLQKTIDNMNYQLTQKKAYYTKMFNNLETTLSGIQSQAQYLSAFSTNSSNSNSSSSSN